MQGIVSCYAVGSSSQEESGHVRSPYITETAPWPPKDHALTLEILRRTETGIPVEL